MTNLYPYVSSAGYGAEAARGYVSYSTTATSNAAAGGCVLRIICCEVGCFLRYFFPFF